MEMSRAPDIILNQVHAERFGQDKLVVSLERLVRLAATSDTGGANVAAQVLLALYNGPEYPMDLTELCRLDDDLFEDALNVIRLRIESQTEPHEFFVDGGRIFQKIAKDWNFLPKNQPTEPNHD